MKNIAALSIIMFLFGCSTVGENLEKISKSPVAITNTDIIVDLFVKEFWNKSVNEIQKGSKT